jgi:hypothetical protein
MFAPAKFDVYIFESIFNTTFTSFINNKITNLQIPYSHVHPNSTQHMYVRTRERLKMATLTYDHNGVQILKSNSDPIHGWKLHSLRPSSVVETYVSNLLQQNARIAEHTKKKKLQTTTNEHAHEHEHSHSDEHEHEHEHEQSSESDSNSAIVDPALLIGHEHDHEHILSHVHDETTESLIETQERPMIGIHLEDTFIGDITSSKYLLEHESYENKLMNSLLERVDAYIKQIPEMTFVVTAHNTSSRIYDVLRERYGIARVFCIDSQSTCQKEEKQIKSYQLYWHSVRCTQLALADALILRHTQTIITNVPVESHFLQLATRVVLGDTSTNEHSKHRTQHSYAEYFGET